MRGSLSPTDRPRTPCTDAWIDDSTAARLSSEPRLAKPDGPAAPPPTSAPNRFELPALAAVANSDRKPGTAVRLPMKRSQLKGLAHRQKGVGPCTEVAMTVARALIPATGSSMPMPVCVSL